MPGDWERFRRDKPCSGLFYGSSLAFEKELCREHPELLIPEGSIVLMDGKAGWSPDDETPAGPDACPKCGDAIEPGSLLYCPKCQASGYDRRAAAQVRLAGVPRKDPAPPEVAAKAEGRRNKRQRKRAKRLAREAARAGA